MESTTGVTTDLIHLVPEPRQRTVAGSLRSIEMLAELPVRAGVETAP